MLESLGEMPLPPYIKEQLDDRERYQTVYSKKQGSAAAPTAGLHLRKRFSMRSGKRRAYCVYHPSCRSWDIPACQCGNVEEHDMHAEFMKCRKKRQHC
ncbi:S-adenosylmethionine:tRNA ribosyltransferase-isomerase [Bacillus licheniformis]|nr:S-adenosylmethionine:tRNA ribosyltransferase-isomerase [Bacillus licheniformis]